MGLLYLSAALGAPAQQLDSLVSPGALSRAHAELSGLRNCTSCHAPGQGIADDKCLACHQDLSQRVRAQTGFHRDKIDCALCHPDHQGEDFPMIEWDPKAFDHRETGYPLLGLHLEIESCQDCHRPPNAPTRVVSPSYLVNDTRCIGCHIDVHRSQLGERCSDCHSLDTPFDDISFDHHQTKFPLVGAHRRVACETCHRDQQWKGLAFSSCTDCHQDPHRPSLGGECLRCHNESSWEVASFNHDRTRFPLLGKHVDVSCELCHSDQRFAGLEFGRCRDCHDEDPHAGQFEEDCGSCHRVEDFATVDFDHSESDYPLTGRHLDVECERCHLEEQNSHFPAGPATAVRYQPLETICRACHEDVHYGQFQNNCESCHVTDGFRGEHLLFQHNRDARFSLLGKHTDATCDQCHRLDRTPFPDGAELAVRYRPLQDFCAACHDNVHDEIWWRTSEPSAFSADSSCERCHTVETFELAFFDHERTPFPLTGAHAAVDCDGCHDFALFESRRYLLFHEGAAACIDCHRSPHLRGMERCAECHTTSTWRVG